MDSDPKELLITELIEANPIIYDKSRHDFKKTEEKEKLWRSICASSGIPGKKLEECKTRWQCLRTFF